jgi:cell division cycle protein 20 (cofactor of APC complex)
LAFKTKAPRPASSFSGSADAHTNGLRVLYSSNKDCSAASLAASAAAKRAFRHVATAPERTLDAPGLTDDYYLNLLEWGPQNLLAIALGKSVYLWNADSGVSELLCESAVEGDLVTSLSWMQDGSHLAVATAHNNDVQMWNVAAGKQVRSMKGHAARVGSLAWNQHILSSGSKDASIFHHDVRMPAHHVATLVGHTQEVCGLKWSPDGTQLASGGNDNLCAIWDVSRSTPKYTFTDSIAAVKALAWCPWQKNLLATGSGTADRHMRFYNTSSGVLLNSVDTQSQVCSLQWSKTDKEILSSHGFRQNQLTLWKYPTLARVADLTGHQARVLHTAVSPDGTTVVSAAADETLRFWKVWDAPQPASTSSVGAGSTLLSKKVEGTSSSLSSSRFIR